MREEGEAPTSRKSLPSITIEKEGLAMHESIPGNRGFRSLYPLPNTTQCAEALCTIRGNININGQSIEITGKGMTPDEALSNWKHMVEAIQPLPTTHNRTAQIATLFSSILAKAVTSKDWSLVDRLGKAATLVLAEKIELGNRPGLLCVKSMTNPDQYYEVEEDACSCPDYRWNHGHACKHVLAVAIWQRLID